MAKHVSALIVNPFSSAVTPELITGVEDVLEPAQTVLTEHAGHGQELAETLQTEVERLYVFAGDGGYNEVVNGMTEPTPVGFLAGGGTSVLPRALGIPRDPVKAALMLAESERVRTITVGRVNGRRFTFNSAVGVIAEVVRRVDALARASGRRPSDTAFLGQLLQILRSNRGKLEEILTVNEHGRGAFAIVANADPSAYMGRLRLRATPEAEFELGLDLIAPKRVRRRDVPRLVYWTFGRPGQLKSSEMIYLHDVDHIEVTCDEPLPLQVDGEDLGDVETAVYEAERGALRVIVSENA